MLLRMQVYIGFFFFSLTLEHFRHIFPFFGDVVLVNDEASGPWLLASNPEASLRVVVIVLMGDDSSKTT